MNYCSRAKIRNRQTLVPRAILFINIWDICIRKKKRFITIETDWEKIIKEIYSNERIVLINFVKKKNHRIR